MLHHICLGYYDQKVLLVKECVFVWAFGGWGWGWELGEEARKTWVLAFILEKTKQLNCKKTREKLLYFLLT